MTTGITTCKLYFSGLFHISPHLIGFCAHHKWTGYIGNELERIEMYQKYSAEIAHASPVNFTVQLTASLAVLNCLYNVHI